jgi:hypothetical protein
MLPTTSDSTSKNAIGTTRPWNSINRILRYLIPITPIVNYQQIPFHPAYPNAHIQTQLAKKLQLPTLQDIRSKSTKHHSSLDELLHLGTSLQLQTNTTLGQTRCGLAQSSLSIYHYIKCIFKNITETSPQVAEFGSSQARID